LWLPALLCGGTSGWQAWLPPLTLLAATCCLMRAWTSGRIKERRPIAALLGFVALGLGWSFLIFSVRAWELPETGEPLDRDAYREVLTAELENRAGPKLQQALTEVERSNLQAWLAPMREITAMPPGVIEAPSATGNPPLLRLVPACDLMRNQLAELAREKRKAGDHPGAFTHTAQMLSLSRTMRNKAPLKYYLAAVRVEAAALKSLDQLCRAGPDQKLLQLISDELKRHEAETPPPVDCLQAECFRSGGVLENAALWTFYSGPGRVPDRWLAGWISLSFETPWEEQRSVRLWQAIWAGLLRGVTTPHWELPQQGGELTNRTEMTRLIMEGWVAPPEGPGARLDRDHLARLLDSSWMSDDRLFTPMVALRSAGNRSAWQVSAARLAVALQLYRLREGTPARQLQQLVPNYLTKLPVDSYSGQSFHYRVSRGEELIYLRPDGRGRTRPEPVRVQPGQAILWSTGPDRTNNGGHKHGERLADNDRGWSTEGFDLLTLVR
jgi:hypothetical protein